MSDSILKQIADLGRLPARDLQDRWRELYGCEPPAYHRRFLVKRLAYRLQELVHGGLPEATKQRMRDILREAGLNEDGLAPPKGPGRTRRCGEGGKPLRRRMSAMQPLETLMPSLGSSPRMRW